MTSTHEAGALLWQHPKQQRQLSRLDSLSICAAMSILFVASLYLFVPRRIQRLRRDDPAQIRWRSFATTIVCAASLIFSRLLSSEEMIVPTSLELSLSLVIHELVSSVVTVGQIVVLYLNPMVLSILRVIRIVNRNNATGIGALSFLKSYYVLCVYPTVGGLLRDGGDEQLQWILLRNYIIGPLTEELVFRCSIIPVLQISGMSDRSIIWIAPMFFGFAHAHHAFLRYTQGLPLISVLLQTCFQFAYTTLFGTYASYVYVRTKSVLAVFACHAFCNVMGLPSLNYCAPSSPHYSSRILLNVFLFIGVLGFILGIVLEVLPHYASVRH